MKQQALLSKMVIEKYGNELYAGAILTVDANRVRIRSGKQ